MTYDFVEFGETAQQPPYKYYGEKKSTLYDGKERTDFRVVLRIFISCEVAYFLEFIREI